MSRWAHCLLLAASIAGCRSDPSLGGVEVGFRVDGATLDFGRALAGTQVSRSLVLHSTGRAEISIEASTESPFTVAEEVALPGGSEVSLPVYFHAGFERAEGTLRLRSNGRTVSVTLIGEGVRPLECNPSARCRVSRFELASGSCVEAIAADGEGCTPASGCLDHGQCRSGVCIGTPRSCDDDDRCTFDACSPEVGCIHTAIACPMPTRECHVPTCDPDQGCGEAPAPDATPCGPLDCVTANLCFAGQCRQVPTPDGLVCLPRTPCQPEGHCKAQRCEQPDPAEMAPAWRVPLPLAPAPGSPLLALDGNLFLQGCDAGCALVSYTGSGFERFAAPFADSQPRRLVAASKAGVVLLAPGGLEALAPTTGAPRWALPFPQLVPPPEASGGQAVCSPDRIALDSTGALVVALSWLAGTADGGEDPDGGGPPDAGTPADAGKTPVEGLQTLLRVGADGGLVLQQAVLGASTESRVALGPDDTLFLYEPSGATARARLAADAGYHLEAWGSFPGADALSVSGERLVVGGSHLLDADGGARLAGLATGLDGGSLALLPRPALLAHGRGYAFSRSCVPPWGPPCAIGEQATFLHAFDLAAGQPVWESKVLPEGALGRLEEAALVSLAGAVATLTEVGLDGGSWAHVQLFAQGKRLFACPFAPNATLGPAVFDRGFVYVLVRRAAGWNLEAYELANLPLETSGWPQRSSLSGTRRAR